MHDIITVKNAKLKTVTVTIESLTVNGRQVTLAIYRQLIEEKLIDYVTGELNGLPWGTVNYHPKCEVTKSHVHVVWQKGDQLRRSMEFTYYLDPESFECDEANDYVKLLMRDIALGRRDDELKPSDDYEYYDDHPSFTKSGLRIETNLRNRKDMDVARYFGRIKEGPCDSYGPDGLKEAKAFFRNMPGDLAAADRKLNAAIKKEIKRRKQIRASIEEIKQLPQLFIAV